MIGISSKSDQGHVFKLVTIVILKADCRHPHTAMISQILMD